MHRTFEQQHRSQFRYCFYEKFSLPNKNLLLLTQYGTADFNNDGLRKIQFESLQTEIYSSKLNHEFI
ncbi:unnamed protein product [Adineta ricciae]|uniref:Uncharacterized protein n=1 Tax=Adineta ricciae TaxID=249248 RepID=A0A815D2F7_ADIRI|nr:unnamed protein product [Adineta ricciae]